MIISIQQIECNFNIIAKNQDAEQDLSELWSPEEPSNIAFKVV